MSARNARFWVYYAPADGMVKLTLRPGQSLAIAEGGATDEGYSHEWTEWTHNGDCITREYASHARDCDGPLEQYSTCEASLDELAAVESYCDMDFVGPPLLVPNWRKVGSCQRDHYAEAMNY
jgi:hypothetical protein